MRAAVRSACGVLILTTAIAAGCRPPLGPSVPLDQTFTLAPDTAAVIEGTGLRLEFVGVSGDSRCPTDVVCVRAGDAVVHIRLREGISVVDGQLHAGDGGSHETRHGAFLLQLTALKPLPLSSQTIRPEDYRATFLVTR